MASISNIPSALITGNRIPYQYFFSKGYGESDVGGGSNPFEAGSYDAALANAGIENFNLMSYSSILPPEAKEVSRSSALKRARFGSVLESIYASMNGVQGQRISAALLVTKITDKKGTYIGSFCTEYTGNDDEKKVLEILLEDTEKMIERRGYGTIQLLWKKKSKGSKTYNFIPEHFIIQSIKVKKKFGSVLAGLFFINYIYPFVEPIRNE